MLRKDKPQEVLLVFPGKFNSPNPQVPLPLLHLASFLITGGYSVKILDMRLENIYGNNLKKCIIQQDEANVKKCEQNLARAKEELTRAESAYNVAHLTYTRLVGVQKVRPELVAQEEIDVAEGKDLEANAGV